MTNETKILEAYVNTIKTQEKAIEKLAEKIEEILLFIDKNNTKKDFWLGNIFFKRRIEDTEEYGDLKILYGGEKLFTTDIEDIKNGGYEDGKYDDRANWYSWWVTTINEDDLIYIAENLKKWILEYIEKEKEKTSKIEKTLQNLLENINLEKIKQEES